MLLANSMTQVCTNSKFVIPESVILSISGVAKPSSTATLAFCFKILQKPLLQIGGPYQDQILRFLEVHSKQINDSAKPNFDTKFDIQRNFLLGLIFLIVT